MNAIAQRPTTGPVFIRSVPSDRWTVARARAHLITALAALLCVTLSSPMGVAAEPPTPIRDDDHEGARLRLPDGALKKIYLTQDNHGAALTSTDGGETWSRPREPIKRWATKTLLDRDGQMHGFFLVLRRVNETGNRIAIDRFLDVWHVKTAGPDKVWEPAKRIQEGWNGSIVSAPLQLESGRIVLPSQDWVPGSRGVPPTGQGYAMTMSSDDGGETWSRSNRITSPVFEGYNGANFGACEPSIVQLEDGRLWMLMRTQAHYLYESYSDDGATWWPGRPSMFHASTGPPSIVRMPDGRLVLFWNNCQMPERIDGQGVYAGRDALHGAVSQDDGKTWRGFREILLDPRRHQSPPRKGDRGTAYPYSVISADGKSVEVTAGQGGHRVVLRIDPDWFLERERKDDFSKGIEGWSLFKGYGEIAGWWRDRVLGPRIVADPARIHGMALHVRKPDEKDADGAVWNFPSGHTGTLRLHVMFRKGHGGGAIALNDRFFEPTDNQANEQAIYELTVRPDGRLADTSYMLPTEKWVRLELTWDTQRRRCQVSIDGRTVGATRQRHETIHGVSYLHLRSTARDLDKAGFLIGSVEARVE